jgi:hypothetical protein
MLGGCSGLLGLNLHAKARGYTDHGHAADEIGVEANFDSGCPSTARQQQMASRSDLVLTLFADLLAFSL